MYNKGFLKIAAASPKVILGDALSNVKEILNVLIEVEKKGAEIVTFPEMAICGYSVCDLVFQDYLYQDNLNAIKYMLDNNPFHGVVIVGTFIKVNNINYNCALVIQKEKILGIVPKWYLPNTYEFYEQRWYSPGSEASFTNVNLFDKNIPFGRLLFVSKNVKFGVEICEDYWVPMSPNEVLYGNGATIVFNPSASPEVVGKNDKRIMLAQAASYKGNGVYVYTSTSPSESTSEVVFSGQKMIVENGEIIAEDSTLSLSSTIIYGDVDISKLNYIRQCKGWGKYIKSSLAKIVEVEFELDESLDFEFEKEIDKMPFLLKKEEEYQSIIDIQALSVKKRLDYIGISKTVIGISGGLDSTLALLSLCHMCDKYNIDRKNIIALTLPTTNTSDITYLNACKMMKLLNVSFKEINIEDDVKRQLDLIGHDQSTKDVTYENVQARFRTYTLMNTANLNNALVIGTSDMSEVALGWSTFNGDQMAMYGINAGLPKTVVKEVVRYYKKIYPEIEDILDSVINTPISPELGGKNQLTEEIIGKYEINDFILYHFLVNGDTDDRIIYLLKKFFKLENKKALEYVNNFYWRFYHQQYKRLTMPEGVKILPLSLSPRTETRLNGDINKPNANKKCKI